MNREHLWATYGPQGGSRQKKNESKHTSLQWKSIILWNSSLCEWIAKTWRQSWARERRWEKERDLTLWLWELSSEECDLNALIVEAEESAWDKEFPTLWPDEENERPLNFSCLFMEGKDGRHGHNKGTTRASNLHAERQEDEEDTASSFSLFFSLRERSLAIDKCHIYYSFSRVYFMLLQSFPRPLFFFFCLTPLSFTSPLIIGCPGDIKTPNRHHNNEPGDICFQHHKSVLGFWWILDNIIMGDYSSARCPCHWPVRASMF